MNVDNIDRLTKRIWNVEEIIRLSEDEMLPKNTTDVLHEYHKFLMDERHSTQMRQAYGRE